MTNINKINNDFESTKIQKNMTNTQKKNLNITKEGKIVNAFYKDPQLSLDETLDTLVISHTEVSMPQKLFEKETPKNNRLKYIAGASVIGMSILGGFTTMLKNFSEKKMNSTKEFLLPGITRNHCINDEIHQSIFSVIQSPNRKTILASLGVITLGSMAFLSKTFIDGFKEVWIKQQEANIQKNLQENLIEVEAQSFSGKIQIIRSMLASKAKLFAEDICPNNVCFQGKNNNYTKKDENNLNLTNSFVIAGIALITIFGLGYFSLKNLRKSEEFIKKGIENTKQGLKNTIDNFNKGISIENVKNHNGEVLTGKDAYKYVIENMLDSINATPDEINSFIQNMNLPQNEKTKFIDYLNRARNQSTEKVNSAIGGSGRNKITYFSHVNDYLSFFYDWLMNPQNPQFKNLFIGISGITALTYCGKSATEAIKDVQVKKYNAEIELDLQKRLVSTELKNFKAKKESAIEPLCEEFNTQKQSGKSKEELKTIADNILFEIKNGPPFVYS